ncbi:MAG: bifunctional 3-deoxy-7-phosphoheptulonate synthase/chorismate mutase type II [bacterium]|nr:bifunctional 3-deoxy-7-phosphoheptulonate synthase/chorismate mutase type II [bacterium]
MPEQLKITNITQWGFEMDDIFRIAGPCSAETEEQVMHTALQLKDTGISALRAGIWKPRTRPGSFEGVGEVGLKWLKNAGKELGVPVTTEVATPGHVEACLKEGIDILWIGARTTSNPFAVQAIADVLQGVDIPVFVKNPVNPDFDLWVGAMERVNKAGITKLGAIHRGFSTYEKTRYRNQPIWRIPIEMKRRNIEIPMICDPSHICGNRDLLLTVAQSAMDFLFDGFMLEVHIDPDNALSDAKQQVTPARFREMIDQLKVKQPHTDSLSFLKEVNDIRKDIDDIDHEILQLLNRRMEDCRNIAQHKMKTNVSTFQPHRWDEVIKSRIKIGYDQQLSETFVLKIYQLIHEESLRVQEDIINV